MRHILVAIIIAFLGAVPVEGQATAPDQIIKEAVDLLEEGLDGRREELKADKESLYSFIDGILLPRFHREYAAAMVLGRNWKTASDDEKSRFVEAFYATLLHRYAEGILEFDTDRVQILPFRGDDKKRITTVKTRVKLDDGTDVMVNYDLVNAKGGWRMFNVTIEGVSYVVNYRKEFAAEIKETSLEAVIERLENEAGIAQHE